MNLLRTFTILLSAFCFSAISAQEQEKEYNFDFIWGVDAETVFDNREGDQTYSPQQTIFFSRLSPSLGVRFGKSEHEKINNDGIKKKYTDVHKLVAGTHYIQPIGIGYKENKFVPTAYYTFSHMVIKEEKRDSSIIRIDGHTSSEFKVWRVSFGMIPRRLMFQRLPEILWSDSMDYYNPNIRGILLQCTKNNLAFHELSLDWRSLQSAEQREAFNVNYNFVKRFRSGLPSTIDPFFIGGNAQLNHLAKRNPAPEGEGVNDDMFAYPYVGLDFSEKTVFDKFRIRAGYAVSFDRCRAIGDWEVDGGLLADLHLLWKKIGIIETLYAGNKQFPLYPMYGSLLNMGDPHYQSSFYSLTSIYSPIVQNQHVNFGAFLDFHVTKEGTSCYQRVVLNVNLGNVDN